MWYFPFWSIGYHDINVVTYLKIDAAQILGKLTTVWFMNKPAALDLPFTISPSKHHSQQLLTLRAGDGLGFEP